MATLVSKGGADLGGDQVEGRRAVLELLRSGRRRPRAVYVSSAIASEDVSEIVELAAGAEASRSSRR